MVSDPNNNVDELNVPDKVASPVFAGFSSAAAAPKPVPDDDEVMTPESARDFAKLDEFLKIMQEELAELKKTRQ